MHCCTTTGPFLREVQKSLIIAIALVLLTFIFSSRLLKHSINNAVYILSRWQIVFIILKCDAHHPLKTGIINVGCWSTTTDNPILSVISFWSLAITGLLIPNTNCLMVFASSFLFGHQYYSTTMCRQMSMI